MKSSLIFISFFIHLQSASAKPMAISELIPTNEIECKKYGGRWEGTTEGRGHLTGCNPATRDGGKNCMHGENCESGVCLKDNKCWGWQFYKGCANFRGHDGIRCVD
jgi:hypothetical protein